MGALTSLDAYLRNDVATTLILFVSHLYLDGMYQMPMMFFIYTSLFHRQMVATHTIKKQEIIKRNFIIF